jgi:uncharacterized protein (TIGR02996 family)
VTVDFEARAKELADRLGQTDYGDGVADLLADALRAAALDEGAREAARAELTRLLAEAKGRALNPPFTVSVDPGAAVPWDAPPQPTPLADIEALQASLAGTPTVPLTAPLAPLTHALERLCWLLGLSGGERRFVTALAEDAGDFDLCSVYADWLEDQGRPEDGIRVRRLVPRDGDIIVMRYPEGAYEYQDVLKTLSAVEGHLKARGVDIFALALHDHDDLTALDPDAMRAAGWVRAVDVLARAGALQAYLKDRWGSAAERAVARHFQDIFGPFA